MGKWISALPQKEGRYHTKPAKDAKIPRSDITDVQKCKVDGRTRMVINREVADEKTASKYKWYAKNGKDVEPIEEPPMEDD